MVFSPFKNLWKKLLKICVLKARRDAGSALNLDLKEMRSCLPLRPVSASSSVLLSCVDSKHLRCIPAFFCYYLHGRKTYFYVGFVCKKYYVVSVSNEIYFLKALVLMFVC